MNGKIVGVIKKMVNLKKCSKFGVSIILKDYKS